MHYIVLLMLFTGSAFASTSDPITPQQDIPVLCQEIDVELRSAVEIGIINEQQAAQISVRCWTYHS